MSDTQAPSQLMQEERMRADLYALLAKLLVQAPSRELLSSLEGLKGDESEIGQAFSTLAKLATNFDEARARQEYEGLFIGMGRGELLPYGSYYLTGFLNEKPLAKLRNAMRDLGIERDEGVKEPEDHIGFLCEMMAGLILGNYRAPAGLATQQIFFKEHIEPWAGHFFADLEKAELSCLYQPIGTIGRLFVAIERDAFAMN